MANQFLLFRLFCNYLRCSSDLQNKFTNVILFLVIYFQNLVLMITFGSDMRLIDECLKFVIA